MVLPASGALSFEQIRNEFGGGYPITLNQYYRGGSLVPNVGLNNNVPTGGQISVSQFYGTGALYGVAGTTISGIIPVTALGDSFATIEVLSDGTAWSNQSPDGRSFLGNWVRTASNNPSDFQVGFVNSSGVINFGDAVNVWHSLNVDRSCGTVRFINEGIGTSFGSITLLFSRNFNDVIFSSTFNFNATIDS